MRLDISPANNPARKPQRELLKPPGSRAQFMSILLMLRRKSALHAPI